MSRAVEAYRGITATEEFQHLAEIRRVMAGHDEAQAIGNAERRGAKAERDKWQGVVAEQAARIAELEAQLNKN